MNSKITYHKEGDYYIPDLYLKKIIIKMIIKLESTEI